MRDDEVGGDMIYIYIYMMIVVIYIYIYIYLVMLVVCDMVISVMYIY